MLPKKSELPKIWGGFRPPRPPGPYAYVNETVTVSSLRLYVDDTTQYTADYSPVVLQHLLNHDMEKLSSWFASNYLQVNEDKTQAMILGNSSYRYVISVNLKQFSLFRYSFSNTIPIFFITFLFALKVILSLSDRYEIFTTDWFGFGSTGYLILIPGGGALGIFWVVMCRPGLQIGTPF